MPPAAPCRIRNPTSSARLEATPHSAEAPVNSAIAVSRTRLPPYRSPSHPEAGMLMARLTRKAMAMPSTAVALTPKSRPMVGRATLTIVASRMLMNMAATKTVPTATFWLIRAPTGFPSPQLRGSESWLLPPGYKTPRAAEIPAARGVVPGADLWLRLLGLGVELGAGSVGLDRLDPVQRGLLALVGFAGRDDLAVAGHQVEVVLPARPLLEHELACHAASFDGHLRTRLPLPAGGRFNPVPCGTWQTA